MIHNLNKIECTEGTFYINGSAQTCENLYKEYIKMKRDKGIPLSCIKFVYQGQSLQIDHVGTFRARIKQWKKE